MRLVLSDRGPDHTLMTSTTGPMPFCSRIASTPLPSTFMLPLLSHFPSKSTTHNSSHHLPQKHSSPSPAPPPHTLPPHSTCITLTIKFTTETLNSSCSAAESSIHRSGAGNPQCTYTALGQFYESARTSPSTKVEVINTGIGVCAAIILRTHARTHDEWNATYPSPQEKIPAAGVTKAGWFRNDTTNPASLQRA